MVTPDPFSAPQAGTSAPMVDLDDARPARIVVIAGAVAMVVGIFVATSGVQLLVLVRFFSWWLQPVPWILMGLGGVLTVAGGLASRGRDVAMVLAAGLSGGSILLLLVWNVFSLLQGLFSPLALLTVPLVAVSAVLSALAVEPARRASRARRALYADPPDGSGA